MEKKRITQKDIASAAGVHRATVSLALRDFPGLPKETRERIQRIAKELGYTPDPMLSALAAYRTRQQAPSFQGILAWLTNSTNGYNWRESPHYADYFRGAQAQAGRHGFQLEEFDINPAQINHARMVAIMKSRGIRGIMLCPQPIGKTSMNFPLTDFSAITFGYTLSSPAIHTVTAAHYQAVRKSFDELAKRGYRRIGLAIPRFVDNRCNNSYLSAYLGKNFNYTQAEACNPLYHEFDNTKQDLSYREEYANMFQKWLKKEKPDAVILSAFNLLDFFKPPADIGLVCPSMPHENPLLSGIVENSVNIGEVAADFLVGMILRGERGVPPYPQRLHVEGKWNEGKTLRPLPA